MYLQENTEKNFFSEMSIEKILCCSFPLKVDKVTISADAIDKHSLLIETMKEVLL